MFLIKGESVEIISTAETGKLSQLSQETWRAHHTPHCAAKRINKFQKTGGVENQPRSERPQTSPEEDMGLV